MKEILLHIGMHKTGSTSIQAGLHGYADGTTRYARFSRPNHSVPIYTIFSSNRHSYHIWKNIGMSKRQIDNEKEAYIKILNKEIRDCGYQRLIISGEAMGILGDEDKVSMLNFFKSKNLDIKIVCFLREPVSFAKSWVQQIVKGGAVSVSTVSPDYTKRLKVFADMIPAGSLIVRDFSAVSNEYQDIVTGFGALCGLDTGRIKPTRRNESLSLTATKLVYRLNRLPFQTFGSPERFAARQKLINVIRTAFPVTGEDQLDESRSALLLGPDVNADIKFVADQFGIRFGEVRHVADVRAYDGYLSDLSDFGQLQFSQMLDKQNIRGSSGDSVDSVLTALYNRFLFDVSPRGRLLKKVRHGCLKCRVCMGGSR